MSSEQATTDEQSESGVELADDALAKVLKREEIGDEELANALGELSPEEAQMFVQALDLALKRRRAMLLGYIGALIALVGGMAVALYVYGSREPGTFVGWVFLIPFALVGLVLMAAGKVAKSGRPIVPKDHPTKSDE